MLPIIGLGLLALGLLSCSQKTEEENAPLEEPRDNPNLTPALLDQASSFFEKAPAGTSLALPYMCASWVKWSRQGLDSEPSTNDLRARCDSRVLNFQENILERFQDGFTVACNIDFPNVGLEQAAILNYGVVCVVTKQ